MPTLPEIGLPILRSTACRVGRHVFIWAGSHLTNQPDSWWRCDCGMMTLEEAKEAQK